MKELIILVFYVNHRGEKTLDEVDNIRQTFTAVEWGDGYNVIPIVVPVTDRPTEVKCIYPIFSDEDQVESALKELQEAIDGINNFLKET